MKIRIERKVKLDFIGEKWKECYLTFYAISVNEQKKLREDASGDDTKLESDIMKLIESKFIEGKALGDEGNLLDVKKENLLDFPVFVLEKVILFLSQG